MARPRRSESIRRAIDSLYASAAHDRADAIMALHMRAARSDLIAFARMMMPDPNGGELEPWKSRYDPKPHHRYLADLLQDVAGGKARRHLAISVPPQSGKTQLASIFFLAWYHGLHPHRHIIFATYNADRAREVAVQVRQVMESPRFGALFPAYGIRSDRRSAEEFTSEAGGNVSFLGRGGSGTGKAADLVVIDDPIKNREEALSDKVIRELHEWYVYVIESRCHIDTRQIVIQTRWSLDDLIGRLCDPENPSCDPEIAKYWLYVNIPAIMRDEPITYALGKQPGDALWPEKFPIELLNRKKKLDKVAFEALYQGRPSPEEGAFFSSGSIITYSSPSEIPKDLEIYGSSDHALTEKQSGDLSCVACWGIDGSGNLWLLPDMVWKRLSPDGLVAAIVGLAKRHRPIMWFGESDMIGRALGPVIVAKMREEGIGTSLWPMPSIASKQARASNLQAMMSLGKVRFPEFVPWWNAAKSELLKFPAHRHDDFVDCIGLAARAIDWLRGGAREVASDPDLPRWMTGRWLLREMSAPTETRGRHYCSL